MIIFYSNLFPVFSRICFTPKALCKIMKNIPIFYSFFLSCRWDTKIVRWPARKSKIYIRFLIVPQRKLFLFFLAPRKMCLNEILHNLFQPAIALPQFCRIYRLLMAEAFSRFRYLLSAAEKYEKGRKFHNHFSSTFYRHTLLLSAL